MSKNYLDYNSLSHTTWECKYHIVFAPKYRRKIIFGKYISISSFMGYLKGKSTLMIFDEFANLKYKYGNRRFWADGYFVSTVGKNEKKIKEYIANQLKEDMASDQIRFKEFDDPFAVEEKQKKKEIFRK